jgi:hypothetical protein
MRLVACRLVLRINFKIHSNISTRAWIYQIQI